MNYHCKNCGENFAGDDFTIECTNCGSMEIEVAKRGASQVKNTSFRDGPKTVIQRPGAGARSKAKPRPKPKKSSGNKVPIYILSALLLLLLIGGGVYYYVEEVQKAEKPAPATGIETMARIEKREGRYFLEAYLFNGQRKLQIDSEEIGRLLRTDGETLNLSDNNEVLFCPEQEGFYSYTVHFEDESWPVAKVEGTELVFNESVMQGEGCVAKLTASDIRVKPEDCLLRVEVVNADRFNGIAVSISGAEGEYKTGKFNWSSKEYSSENDIFIRVNGTDDPIAYAHNPVKAPACIKDRKRQNGVVFEKEIAKDKAAIEDYLRAFCSDPGHHFFLFQRLVSQKYNGKFIAYLDGQVNNEVYLDIQQNMDVQKRYELSSVSFDRSTNTWRVKFSTL